MCQVILKLKDTLQKQGKIVIGCDWGVKRGDTHAETPLGDRELPPSDRG